MSVRAVESTARAVSVGEMVNVACVSALGVLPVMNALALTVDVFEIVTGAVYRDEDSKGSELSSVKRIAAPDAGVERVMVTASG